MEILCGQMALFSSAYLDGVRQGHEMFVSAVSCCCVHNYSINVGKAELWFGVGGVMTAALCEGGGGLPASASVEDSGGERGLGALSQTQMFFLCVGNLLLMWSFDNC